MTEQTSSIELDSKLKNCILAVLSDLHVGSLVGVCPNNLRTDGGGYHSPNRIQAEELNPQLQNYFDFCLETSIKFGYPLVGIVNGDAVQGTRETQISTVNELDQVNGAFDLLKPFRNACDHWLMTRGTPFHVGALAKSEETLGRFLESKQNSAKDFTHYRLNLVVGGVRFDIMHHIGTNSVPWTRGTNIRSEVLRTVFECNESRVPVPDVVIRSHAHLFADTGETFRTRGFVTPAFQAITDFGHKVPRPYFADIGGLMFIVDNGTYTPIHRHKRLGGPEEILL